MNKIFLVAAGALALAAAPALAADVPVRTWPGSGKWSVWLSRGDDSSLTCNIVTSDINNLKSGFAQIGIIGTTVGTAVLFIADSDFHRFPGQKIDIRKDGGEVQAFQVTNRGPNPGMGWFESAMLPGLAGESWIEDALTKPGSTIEFVTAGQSYQAPLKGAPTAWKHFVDCREELLAFTG